MRTLKTKNYFYKIAYHSFMGNLSKVMYFTEKQIETYGPITPLDQMEIASHIRCLFLEKAIEREKEIKELMKV